MCIPPARQIDIARTPVHQIALGQVQEWESSAAAHVQAGLQNGSVPDSTWPDEVRAFLPRMFELISAGEDPAPLGIETSFRTAALAGWQDWPRREQDMLTGFAEAFFLARLARVHLAWAPIGHVLNLGTDGQDAAEALLILGLPLARVIDLWQRAPDPAGAVHLAEARRAITHDRKTGLALQGNWLDDYEMRRALADWQSSQEVSTRLEAAFFALTAEDHDSKAMRDIISRGLG